MSHEVCDNYRFLDGRCLRRPSLLVSIFHRRGSFLDAILKNPEALEPLPWNLAASGDDPDAQRSFGSTRRLRAAPFLNLDNREKS
jgi:hypothetical protein